MLLDSFFDHFAAIQAPYWFFSLGIFIAVWYLDGNKNPAGPAFIAYLVLVYTTTVFSRDTNTVYQYKLVPFWSLYQIIKNENYFLLVEDLLNIVMMIPVGFLLPFAAEKFDLWRCIRVTIFIEAFIELSQLVLKKGLCEWDDVIMGILGCIIGYLFYRIIKFIIVDADIYDEDEAQEDEDL